MIGAASGTRPAAFSQHAILLQHAAARDALALESAVLQTTDDTRQAKRGSRSGPQPGSEMSHLVQDPREGPSRKSRATRMEHTTRCAHAIRSGAPIRYTAPSTCRSFPHSLGERPYMRLNSRLNCEELA